MRCFLLFFCLISFSVSAAPVESQSSMESFDGIFDLKNTSEMGLQIHSINDGTGFFTASLLRDFFDVMALGVRGFVPLEAGDDSQIFMGQLFGRAYLTNTENLMFLEATLTQGFVNQPGKARPFAMAGLSYGFARKITSEFSLGLNVGADYSNSRVKRDQLVLSSSSLYSRMTVMGGYHF